jgi:hypothetical protein
MKPLITFVFGALAGASLLWFGFCKKVVILNNRLVVVDCFSGKANRVFISHLEADQLERAEARRIEDLNENGTLNAAAAAKPSAEVPEWRELNEAEIKQLEFKWKPNGSGRNTVLEYHNPFPKSVKIERVRFQIPVRDDRAAIDREYQAGNRVCAPQSDLTQVLDSMELSTNEFHAPGNDLLNMGATLTPIRVLILK